MNKVGFGFLRLPVIAGSDPKQYDLSLLERLVDRFLELGGNYFDTAYTYPGSEEALRKTLVERHPRSSFRIANKLPGWKIGSYEQCQDYFDEQLRRCGVSYFDVYLLHDLNERNYQTAQKARQFRFIRELREKGLVKAIGFSYHDGPELLDRILAEHPEVDYVQLQINYLDWENPAIQSAACYETALRHGKKVLVMEPVKGGNLANIPEEADRLLKGYYPDRSIPAWAIQFASSLAQVEIVLSGMNTMAQIEDNLRQQDNMGQKEFFLLLQAAQIIRSKTAIGCTGCAYCTDGCPQNIPIPGIFTLYNEYHRYPTELWKLQGSYDKLTERAAASDCIECSQCQLHCPQKLPVIQGLKEAAQVFENDKR